MSIKLKRMRTGKVIELREKVGEIYGGGIHSLAEETGLGMDDLFQMLFALSLSGLILPTVLMQKDGTQKIGWMVSRNEKDTKRMRKMLIGGIDSYAEVEGDMENTKDRIFGRWLDRQKEKA